MQKITPSVRSKKIQRSPLVVVLLFLIVAGGTLLTTNLTQQVAHAAATNLAVTTYRNDNAHTGPYPNETALTTSNVNLSQFGKRVSYPVDSQLYAQPLSLPNLTIGGTVHNVVFAATENASVYAFDADQTNAVAPLWKTSLLPSGATAVPIASVFNGGDLNPMIGITGTPVIDPSTNTIYIVAYSQESGSLLYRFHALDVTTGKEKGTPIVIQGSAPGTGAGSVGGIIAFDPHTGGVSAPRSSCRGGKSMSPSPPSAIVAPIMAGSSAIVSMGPPFSKRMPTTTRLRDQREGSGEVMADWPLTTTATSTLSMAMGPSMPIPGEAMSAIALCA